MMGFRVFVSVMKSKIETAANHVLTICLGNARFPTRMTGRSCLHGLTRLFECFCFVVL